VLEAGIHQLVTADPGVQAVIGDRFYPVVMIENTIYPCASYQVISDVPEYALDRSPGVEAIRLQVDTWSGGASNANYSDVKAAQAAIRKVLDLYSGLLPEGTRVAAIFVATASDTFEQDARCYRTTTDYMVHFYPGN
jgi:hypothetical protein